LAAGVTGAYVIAFTSCLVWVNTGAGATTAAGTATFTGVICY